MTFTTEQKLLHQVVLHANDVPARGLFGGQMGILLVLSEYARLRKLRPLRTAISFHLEITGRAKIEKNTMCNNFKK